MASHQQELFKDYGSFEEWPHAEGSLGLNPLYIEEKRDSLEEIQLRRTFPSAFYIEEHAQSKDYLPETVKVLSHVLADLAHSKRTPEIETLIEKFIVLGVPDRFQ